MRALPLITVVFVLLGCGAAEQKVDLGSLRVIDSLLLFNDYGELIEAYGQENVRVIPHTTNDNGESASGAVLFPGTRSEVVITWGDDPYVPAVEYYRTVRVSVKTAGLPEAAVKGWKTNAGVALGMSLNDIDAIAGVPHRFASQNDSLDGWDGALSDHLLVFEPGAYRGEKNPHLIALSVVGFYTNPKSTYVFDSPMDNNEEEEEAAAAAYEEANRREREAKPDYIDRNNEEEMRKFLANSEWKSSEGGAASEEDAPGTVILYFISSEGKMAAVDFNAAGAAIPPAWADVKQVLVEVIPKIKGDFIFSVQTNCSYEGCGNLEYIRFFGDAEPGIPYSIVIQNDGSQQYLCSGMRIAVRSGELLTVRTAEVSCGG